MVIIGKICEPLKVIHMIANVTPAKPAAAAVPCSLVPAQSPKTSSVTVMLPINSAIIPFSFISISHPVRNVSDDSALLGQYLKGEHGKNLKNAVFDCFFSHVRSYSNSLEIAIIPRSSTFIAGNGYNRRSIGPIGRFF